MSEMITAIYEKGLLRPIRRLTLPERTRVDLRIVARYEGGADERQQVRQALLDAGCDSPGAVIDRPTPLVRLRRGAVNLSAICQPCPTRLQPAGFALYLR